MPAGATLLGPLLAARAAGRRAAARRVLASAPPWEELRRTLAGAVVADPATALPALESLAAVAQDGGDRALAGRLAAYAGHAVHRAGRLDDAVAAYARAERDLRGAGLPAEALATAVVRVDALAGAGRPAAALRLADRLAPAVPRGDVRRGAGLLVHRGNALRLLGDADGARRAYARAARAFDAAGDRVRGDVARLNAAVAAVEAGDAVAARDELERVATSLAAAGQADLAREAQANLAWALVHAGALGDGIRRLDRLAREHRDAGLARREGALRADLADALRRAGDAVAAEREAAAAAARFDAAGAPAERAEALVVAAEAAVALDVRRARVHARAAATAAAAAGREAVALRADLVLAQLARRAGTAPTAASSGALTARAAALRHAELVAQGHLLAGACALDRADGRAARTAFGAARRAAAGRPILRLAADAGLAAADALEPARVGSALARLRRVAAATDAVRADLPGAWLRASFAADRLDPWLARVDVLLARGTARDRDEAERVLDALAARRFLGARAPAGGRAAARIRARLESIYDRLARGDGPTRGDAAPALERRARAWERALASSWRRAERRVAREAAPARGATVPAAPDVAWVHVARRDDRVVGLARVGADVGDAADLGPAARFFAWSEALRLRAHRWAFVKDADPAARDAVAVEALLAEVADATLAPLGVGRWPRDVRIVADPTLPDLPWELLPCRGRRLGQSYALLRAPAGRTAPAARAAGTGALVVGVGAPDLPGVGREVEDVARVLPDARLVAGADATRAVLAQGLRTASVVHVAGHGWDASEAPPLAGVRLADGWFSAHDVPDVVAADLVVLAACRTGRAAGPAVLAWGGLVSALLARGAGRVVWTADDVEDGAAARVMVAFHETRRSCDDREAFGAALARAAAEVGHPGAVLSFRMSGTPA
ncbi:MAG: CHAT domain-containing protein [Planctomycetes bacterium]|nr:CHAT domain-containing protein [Planctomycetota bacterium]